MYWNKCKAKKVAELNAYAGRENCTEIKKGFDDRHFLLSYKTC